MQKKEHPKMKEHPKTVLVLCAHNDDQLIGAGGTIATYAHQGIQVKTIIFAFGAGSHPHLKPEVIIRKRVKESLESDKILGGAGVAYFGLREGKFREDIDRRNIADKIRWIINKEQPIRIFTHSPNDFHPDHRAVHALVEHLIKDKSIACPVYCFDIWNPFSIALRGRPRLVIDISNFVKKKFESIRAHKSQRLSIVMLFWNIYLKGKINGLLNGVEYAEVFTQLA